MRSQEVSRYCFVRSQEVAGLARADEAGRAQAQVARRWSRAGEAGHAQEQVAHRRSRDILSRYSCAN